MVGTGGCRLVSGEDVVDVFVLRVRTRFVLCVMVALVLITGVVVGEVMSVGEIFGGIEKVNDEVTKLDKIVSDVEGAVDEVDGVFEIN